MTIPIANPHGRPYNHRYAEQVSELRWHVFIRRFWVALGMDDKSREARAARWHAGE
jgi:hypothetical protein